MTAMALTFDTHEIIKKFREKGLAEELAEVQVDAIKDMVNQAVNQVQHNYELDNLVTNKDLDARIKELELKIELAKTDLMREVEKSKSDLMRLGFLQIGLIVALLLKVVGMF
jgi:hypothetical protein